MKKFLLIALVAVLALATGAWATGTRTFVMGQTNNILLDEDNCFMYASRINMYPNVAVADAGQLASYNTDYYYDIASFGVHWKFNEKNPWVLGTYFYTSGQQVGGWNLGLSNTWLPFWYPQPNLYWLPSVGDNKRVTMIYGRKLGGNYFGFSLNKVQASWKDESATAVNDGKRGVGEYDFSVSLTDANGKWDVAAGLNLLSFSYMTSPTLYQYKSKGGNSMYVYGRYFHQVNPQWTIVPNGGIILSKYSAEYFGSDTVASNNYTDKYNTFTVYGGLGAHYTPATNVLAVGEIGLAMNTYKRTYTRVTQQVFDSSFEYKENWMTMPYFKVGMEGKVFDWMDIRLGATSYWQRETDERTMSSPYKEKYNYPHNDTYLGTGLHFGNLHIDTYTDPSILLRGFYFISGNGNNYYSEEDYPDLNFHVSLLYEFK